MSTEAKLVLSFKATVTSIVLVAGLFGQNQWTARTYAGIHSDASRTAEKKQGGALAVPSDVVETVHPERATRPYCR